MVSFDPRLITVRSAHFIGGQYSGAQPGLEGVRASDGQVNVEPDIAKPRASWKLEAGTVSVNRYGRSNDYFLPTGGYKRSGIGKDLGREALEANLRFKSVLIDILQYPPVAAVEPSFAGVAADEPARLRSAAKQS